MRTTNWSHAFVASIAASILLSTGCSAVIPYQKGDIEDEYTWPRDETGIEYCSRLATTTDSSAQKKLVAGVIATVLAAGAIIAGSAMGPDTDEDATWVQRDRNTLVLSAGGLMAVPATLWLARSASASNASAEAGKAMTLEGSAAMEKCLATRAVFVSDRAAAANNVKSELDKHAAKARELQAEIGKLKEEAAAAQKKAMDSAQPPAVQAQAAVEKGALDAKIAEKKALLQKEAEELVKITVGAP